jgi:hypothetical protein
MNFAHHARQRTCPSSFRPSYIATTNVVRGLKSSSHKIQLSRVAKNSSSSLSARLSRRHTASLRTKSIHSVGKPPNTGIGLKATFNGQQPPQIKDLGRWKDRPLHRKLKTHSPLPKKNGIRPPPKQSGAPNKSQPGEDKNPALKQGWKGEEWQEKWYNDESDSSLSSTPSTSSNVAPREPQSKTRSSAPPRSSSTWPLPYTRRVEGFLNGEHGPILQGHQIFAYVFFTKSYRYVQM